MSFSKTDRPPRSKSSRHWGSQVWSSTWPCWLPSCCCLVITINGGSTMRNYCKGCHQSLWPFNGVQHISTWFNICLSVLSSIRNVDACAAFMDHYRADITKWHIHTYPKYYHQNHEPPMNRSNTRDSWGVFDIGGGIWKVLFGTRLRFNPCQTIIPDESCRVHIVSTMFLHWFMDIGLT